MTPTALSLAVERLDSEARYPTSGANAMVKRADLRIVLRALSLYKAECEAWRRWYVWAGGDEWGKMMNAWAATDAEVKE